MGCAFRERSAAREREAFFLSLVAGIFGADRFYLGLWVSGRLEEKQGLGDGSGLFQGPGLFAFADVSS